MSGGANINNNFDINLLKNESKRILKEKLLSVNGVKDLVIDLELMTPLDRIIGASFLRENGIRNIYKLESASTNTIENNITKIYMIKSQVNLARMVANQINAERNQMQVLPTNNKKYYVFLVPRQIYACEFVFEEEGVFGYVQIDSLPLYFFPLDPDLISLELINFFKSVYLEGDLTHIHDVASSIVNLECLYGNIQTVYSIGKFAQMVDKLSKVLKDGSNKNQYKGDSKIESLFLIDRECDYVTPLCSQVTYEGLLDDMFKINSGYIEFSPEVTGSEKSTKHLLSNQDLIFEEIRNRHFSSISSYISAEVKIIDAISKRSKSGNLPETKELAKDVNALKKFQSLSIHVGACEVISKKKTASEFDLQLRVEHSLLEGFDMKFCTNHIEELIIKQVDAVRCLSLLCLMSLTEGGLQPAAFKSFKMLYMQSFGFDKIASFYNLKKLGLFTECGQSTAARHLGKVASVVKMPFSGSFRSVCKKLNLIPKSSEEINLKIPSDMSYVFSGAYIPFLCRLVEQVLVNEGFVGIEEIFKTVGINISSRRALEKGNRRDASKTIIIYFIGGCTYSEVAALRFLAKQRGLNLLVATTCILNNQSIVSAAM